MLHYIHLGFEIQFCSFSFGTAHILKESVCLPLLTKCVMQAKHIPGNRTLAPAPPNTQDQGMQEADVDVAKVPKMQYYFYITIWNN